MGYAGNRPIGAGGETARLSRNEISDALNAAPAAALLYIMPDGYLDGREFRCGDVYGTAPSSKDGGSFNFNIDKLTGADFSPNSVAIKNTFGGVLDVYVVHHHGDFKAAHETALTFLGMNEADRQQPRQGKGGRSKSKITTWIGATPNADAPAPKFQSLWKGRFRQAWAYRDHAGNLLFYVARYEDNTGRKATPVVSWGHVGDGVYHWRAKGAGQNILFGLELLATYPSSAEIWIFEGEKTATHARTLFPDVACLAWKGGAENIKNIDMSALSGRRVRFVPDADKDGVGQKAMGIAATKASAAGTAAVAVVTMPTTFEDGWDVADRLPRGWTIEKIRCLIESAAWQGPPTSPPPRGTKEGIAPHWKVNPRPVSEVRSDLDRIVRDNRHRSIALRITPGAGKTRTEIEASKEADEWNIFAEPNHAIAHEVLADMGGKAAGFGHHLAGRGYVENGESLCHFPEDAEAANAAGLNTYTDLCMHCPERLGCRFLEKLARIGDAMRTKDCGSIVTVHPYFHQAISKEIDASKIARIIIDERIDLDRETRIPADRMHECCNAVLGADIVSAFDQSGFLDLTQFNADDLEDRAKAEGHSLRLKLEDGMTFDERRAAIRKHAEQRKVEYRWRFQILFSTMAKEIRNGRTSSNQVVMVKGIKIGKAEPRDYICIYGKKQVGERLTGLPIHYIDGTMDLIHAQALLGDDCEFFRLDAERNLHVTQVSDSLFSKNRLLNRTESPEYRKELYRFLQALATKHRKILVGVPKQIRDVMEAEWQIIASTMAAPPTVSWIHHNKGRGENAYKDYDCCVEIGREEPSVRSVEAMARMRRPDVAITPIPATEADGDNGPAWPKRWQGYSMKNGRWIGVEVSYHPDPLCQSVLEQVREGEMVQIIDRLRGVGRADTAAVYILCNIPTEIPVDRLVSWRDLLKEVAGNHEGKRHWWQEAVRIGGGVAPLKSDWLVNAGIFSTKSSAEQAVSRLVRIIRQQIYDINIDVLSDYPTLTEFRLQNQRHGKNSLALVGRDVTNAVDILTNHVGELRMFDGEQVQPEPGAYEPEMDDDEVHEAAAYEPDEPAIAAATTAGKPITLDTNEGFQEAILWMRALSSAGVLERAMAKTWTGDPGPTELLDVLTAMDSQRRLVTPTRTW